MKTRKTARTTSSSDNSDCPEEEHSGSTGPMVSQHRKGGTIFQRGVVELVLISVAECGCLPGGTYYPVRTQSKHVHCYQSS